MFEIGNRYTRAGVQAILEVPVESRRGGDWATGYTRYNDAFYVFCGVGSAGRTGHDYGNHWVGDDLHWAAKTQARPHHQQFRDLVGGRYPVHIFYRTGDRDSFIYAGEARAQQVDDTKQPLEVIWTFDTEQGGEELDPGGLPEGATKSVVVNAFERNPEARRRCLQHYGYRCNACDVLLSDSYGSLADAFIHVHHIVPLGQIKAEYEVDPIQDLRPLCPNCHAIVHRRRRRVLSIEDLREAIARVRGSTTRP
jgi:5-methylcytosine-specific restriction enzyme A